MRRGSWVVVVGCAGLITACGSRTALRVRDGSVVPMPDAASADVGAEEPDVEEPDAGVDVAALPEAGPRDAEPDRPNCLRDPSVCDDRNACTTDVCLGAERGCAHEAIACRDDDPCTADTCDPVAGCIFPAIACGGCADGERDAFRDRARYPGLAGCAGGFTNAGLSRVSGASCGRGAGDDGANPDGRGCSATDLCALGWHVCLSAQEVASRSPDGCLGAQDAGEREFYATRQTGPGCGQCATGDARDCTANDCRGDCAQTERTTNDIFGCGTLGATPNAQSCGVLDRFSNNQCGALVPPWRCDDDPNGFRESDFVVKPGPAAGGVLCCED